MEPREQLPPITFLGQDSIQLVGPMQMEIYGCLEVLDLIKMALKVILTIYGNTILLVIGGPGLVVVIEFIKIHFKIISMEQKERHRLITFQVQDIAQQVG
jgi:hypothetical protein